MVESAPRPAPPAEKRIGGVVGLAIVAVTIPAACWLAVGRIDELAVGLTSFLVIVAAAVEYLPRATQGRDARELGPRADVQRRWWDVLGVVWLLAIPFAPFLTWVLRHGIDVDRGNWMPILAISALMCVGVPVLCVLPLLRYVRRGTAGMALAILAIGTAFPVVTGLGSAYDVIRGPAWQDVNIVTLEDVDFRTGTGTRVHAEDALVKLLDGRTLGRSSSVVLRPGPARLLVLRGMGRVIDVER